jgi:hypothetical protein
MTLMNQFPGDLYQIGAETLRGQYRLSNRLMDNNRVMTPDERYDLAQRMRTLLRKTERVDTMVRSGGVYS